MVAGISPSAKPEGPAPMSRKHYAAIAQALRQSASPYATNLAVAEAIRPFNSSFDLCKFMREAGTPYVHNVHLGP